MKKIVFVLMIIAGLTGNVFAKGNETGEKEVGNTPAPSSASILFVGMKEYNVSSNYYTKDQFAASFNVPESEVEHFFNRTICDTFNEIAAKKGFRVSACDESVVPVVSDLGYDYENGIVYSDLSGVDAEEYHRIMEQSGAEYLLVCDQYYVKKEGHPYDNFAHILHYSLFDTSREKVYDGLYQYAALDLGNTALLEKQLKKAADKFLKAIQ